jgi:two-component system response regulator RegX3
VAGQDPQGLVVELGPLSMALAGLTVSQTAGIIALPAATDQLPRYLVQGEMEPKTLLLIARTQSLVKHLQSALDASRYVIRWAPSSSQALGFDLHPSLLVLELPASGGTRSVARLKRRFDAPLLALAGKGQPGLAQADAYLVRPYRIGELVELIDTTLINHAPDIIRAENMSLDTEQRRLQVNGLVHQLRPLACSILALLMLRSGQVVPRDELFRRVWRTTDGEDSTRALDVHIAYLRRKLETDPRKPRLIVTERGVGYRLRPPD